LNSINELKNDKPKINVFNRQRKLRVELAALRAFLNSVRTRLGLKAAFSVVLVNDRVMQKFNAQYAARQHTTDVLSFPADSDGEEPYLGDIIVSVETAERQRGNTLDKELQILTLHGILHLLGYDHESDDGEMTSLENSLREEFGLE
jgi:probable rRNA maturation factor